MAKVTRIRKRDGSIVPFEPKKIELAIGKALSAVGQKDGQRAKRIAKLVVDKVEKTYAKKAIPTVEDVQDLVEETLVKNRLPKVAKAYILYRQKHKELRAFKTFMGVRDDLKMPANAIKVLARRYLLRNDQGKIIETPRRLFQRVAKAMASKDKSYDPRANLKKTESTFFEMMAELEFMPNTPTLMNAGTALGQLSACFVLPVEEGWNQV